MRPHPIAADRQYWEQHLAGQDFVAGTPPSLAGAQAGEPAFAEPTFALTETTAAGLLKLSGGSDLALFTLLLTGLRHLLARYSGERRVAIISTRFVSAAPALAPAEPLVLARAIDPAETFAAAMQAEREVVLSARRHQAFPFARARAWLAADPTTAAGGVGLTLDNLQPPPSAAALPPLALGFHFLHHADGAIVGRVTTDATRFPAAYVAQLGRHLDLLLAAGVGASNTRPATVELVTPAERSALWRDAHTTPAPPGTIGDAFSAVVGAHGERVALRCQGQSLTYAELDRRANRLAHHLLARSLRPEEPVALWLGRSIEVVIGMLGILRAGGCYLPIDPTFPPARNQFLLADTGTRYLLGMGPRPPALADTLHWIDLDAASDWWRHHPTTKPTAPVDPAGIAYVLYTSGTTGQPKGVPITHAGVVHLARCNQIIPEATDQTLLLHAALTFDASTVEIWTALLNGATLVIDPARPRGLAETAAWQRAEGVTAVGNTTALFHIAAQEEPPVLPPGHLHWVGGDAMSARHVRRFLAGYKGLLVNVYGPTEHTAVATIHALTCTSPVDDPLPIGRPLGANEVCILDPQLRPVPPGVVGEIYLGGPGLARGYLRRPALTAACFIPHPYSTAPGARLYRSGDRARFRLDGVIEFVGRCDDQIKVRGFRIEPAEVEHHLNTHPAVSTAAIIAAADEHGGKRLLAFVVARPGHAPTTTELRDYLRARMPEHQIPAAFHFPESLPVTAHGKIDRARLPTLSTAPTSQTDQPPTTSAELAMAAIWQEVLGRVGFGVNDDFFDIGGDSLSAMQVLARINKSGLTLAARRFFLNPTIAGCVAAARPTDANGRPVAGPPVGEVPLTAVQQWFLTTHPIEPELFNLSVMLELTTPLDHAQVKTAVTAVIRHHDALQLGFVRRDTEWRARYLLHDDAALFTSEDLSSLPPAERTAEQTRRATAHQRSLDLARGPLFRAVLFQRGDSEADRLLCVAHHLVVDLVSWRILLDDLDHALNQAQAHQPIQLPGGTDRFGTWARQLSTYLRSPAAAAGRAYWLGLAAQVAAQPSSPPLPPSTAEPDWQDRRLDAATTAALLREAVARSVTMEELLLAVLARTAGELTGRHDFAVNLDRHGRVEDVGELDVSRTVGWFTSIVPVYFRLTPAEAFAADLTCVQATLRSLPHRGIDHSLLRYLGEPAEQQQLAALPEPWMSLNYQGEFDPELGRLRHLALSSDDPGPQRSHHHRRQTAIDLEVRILAGEMELQANAPGSVTTNQIGGLLDVVTSRLRDLVAPAAAEPTPALKPLASLAQPGPAR